MIESDRYPWDQCRGCFKVRPILERFLCHVCLKVVHPRLWEELSSAGRIDRWATAIKRPYHGPGGYGTEEYQEVKAQRVEIYAQQFEETGRISYLPHAGKEECAA